jgi:hypothetical protein
MHNTFESYEMICGDCGEWEETLVDDVTGEGLGICGPCYDQNVVR